MKRHPLERIVSHGGYMKHWKLKPRNLVADKNGDTWTADGLVPFPLDGWNFARAFKARIGWWIDHDERFITRDPAAFRVLQRSG